MEFFKTIPDSQKRRLKTVYFPYDENIDFNVSETLKNINEIKIKYGINIDEKKRKYDKTQTKPKDITHYDEDNNKQYEECIELILDKMEKLKEDEEYQ